MNYEYVELSEIADIIDSLHKTPKYSDEGIPMVRVTNIKEGMLDLSDTLKVNEEVYEEFTKKYVPQKGDILMSRVGTYGICSFVDTSEKFCLGQNTIVIHPKIDAYYLYYSLISTEVKHQIEEYVGGSTQKTISLTNIKKLKIKLPDEKTQEKISSMLRIIDEKIVINNKINANLIELAYAVYKNWYIDYKPFVENGMIDTEYGEIPNGWRIATLDEVIDFSNGYAFKSKELLSEPTDNCHKVFKMGHINKGGGLNHKGTKSWIEKDKCEKLEKYLLRQGDLLMCMTDMKDNVALLGHTALMDVDNEYIVNQRVGLIRSKHKHGIEYPFLYLLTNHYGFLEELRSRANRGVQVNLSTVEIKVSKFIMAPEEVNIRFDKVVRPFFEELQINNQESMKLEILRDTLLTKLMSGEINLEEIDLDIQ